MSSAEVVLVTAGICTGWFAGLLYSFGVAVVPGLRAASAQAHIEVMQTINLKIENPVFFLSFIGPFILLTISAIMFHGKPAFLWIIAALILHFLACAITGGGNIPLNKQLAKLKAKDVSDSEAEKIRQDFQKPGSKWMVYHTLRTLTATGALACVLVAATV